MKAEIRPLSRFAYRSPASLDEAISLLGEHGDRARVLAGGTDLLVWMKKQAVVPDVIVDIGRISRLSFIQVREEGICIGGATPLNKIKSSRDVQNRAPLLVEAIGKLACHPLRNRATLGGNLCSASPAADSAPPLLVLNSTVKLEGPRGERSFPLSTFFLGPGQTLKRPDEILTEVIIPHRSGESAFVKLGRRKGLTLSVVSAAVFCGIVGNKFKEVSVALGAVAPIPFLSKKVGPALKDQGVDSEQIEHAAELIKSEISPITDVRASAEYRREMAGVMVRKALRRAAMGEN